MHSTWISLLYSLQKQYCSSLDNFIHRILQSSNNLKKKKKFTKEKSIHRVPLGIVIIRNVQEPIQYVILPKNSQS